MNIEMVVQSERRHREWLLLRGGELHGERYSVQALPVENFGGLHGR
jgi:hypothetical protein